MDVADGVNDGVVEVIDVVGDEVGQSRVLGVAPEGFDRIEVGRVGREPFDVEPSCSPLVQSAHGRAMDVEPIQDHDQRPPMQTMQLSQVPHHVAGSHVPILHDEVRSNPSASRRETQAADHAQAVVPLRHDLLGP